MLFMTEKIPQENLKKIESVEPGLVRQIEAINLDAKQKGEILLVIMRVKPSAWIGFEVKIWNEGESPHIFKTEKDIEEIYKIIGESGLSFKILPREVRAEKRFIRKREVNAYHDNVKILVGWNNEALANLAQALESKNHELIGKALGIPETAIEAFVGKRQTLNLRAIPKKDLLSEPFLFSPTPTLSKDNWQNEIQEGKKRAEALKIASPKIYKEMVQNTLRSYKEWGLL